MKEQYVTIKFNGALAKEIEEFLKENPQHGTFEEFVGDAGRRREEQLSPLARSGEPASVREKEDYSEPAVEAADHALNSRPVSAEDKTRVAKDLAATFRRLKKEAANRGDTR